MSEDHVQVGDTANEVFISYKHGDEDLDLDLALGAIQVVYGYVEAMNRPTEKLWSTLQYQNYDVVFEMGPTALALYHLHLNEASEALKAYTEFFRAMVQMREHTFSIKRSGEEVI